MRTSWRIFGDRSYGLYNHCSKDALIVSTFRDSPAVRSNFTHRPRRPLAIDRDEFVQPTCGSKWEEVFRDMLERDGERRQALGGGSAGYDSGQLTRRPCDSSSFLRCRCIRNFMTIDLRYSSEEN